jgi:hypothetical protein
MRRNTKPYMRRITRGNIQRSRRRIIPRRSGVSRGRAA